MPATICHLHLAPLEPLPNIPTQIAERAHIDLGACHEPDSHLIANLLVLIKQLQGLGYQSIDLINTTPAVEEAVRFLGIPRMLRAA